jgi:DNA-directed RNA polymerase I subunit RPA43
MAVEEKKRKHKDSSEKSSKKKHKSITKIIAPTSPVSSVGSAAPIASTSFSEVVVKLYLHLAPVWSGKTMEGVNEQLNAFLMKYVYGLLETSFSVIA